MESIISKRCAQCIVVSMFCFTSVVLKGGIIGVIM
jgi:hypothetical protein